MQVVSHLNNVLCGWCFMWMVFHPNDVLLRWFVMWALRWCTSLERLIGQSVLETKFNRTWCPYDANTCSRTSDLQKTKFVVVNKTWKVEVHITDNQSWNSCHRVVSDPEFILGSPIEPIKHNALWPCTIHGHLLQPKQGAPAVQMHLSTRLSLHWPEAWIWWGKVALAGLSAAL